MNNNNKQQLDIQKAVIEYFEKFDTLIVLDVINSFVYMQPAKTSEISKIITKFIDDNGLTQAYVNHLSDISRKDTILFFRSSSSEAEMINQLKIAFLNLSFNRFIQQEDVKRKKRDKNITKFNYVKTELLNVYDCLNRNENFIYGKDEDEKMVKKIKNMNYES